MSTDIESRNIVILPSPEVRDKAIEMSEAISGQAPVKFTLDRGQHMPHMTVHQFAVPTRQLAKLEEIVQWIANRTAPFEVQMNDFSLFGGTGIFWDATVDEPIKALHETTVREVETVREGYIMFQHASFLTGEGINIGIRRRQSLGQWGNPLAMDTLNPHITLTACDKDADAERILKTLAPVLMRFRVEKLYVTPVGPNGTCPEIIKEFPLGG